MATLNTLTSRLLLAGGFAVAIAATPVVVALTAPAGLTPHAVAQCSSTEILDPVTGTCGPDLAGSQPTQNPIDPEHAQLQTGALTEGSGTGNVGQLPSVDGIPCNGGNVGQCIGLEESKGANNVELPPVPIGVVTP